MKNKKLEKQFFENIVVVKLRCLNCLESLQLNRVPKDMTILIVLLHNSKKFLVTLDPCFTYKYFYLFHIHPCFLLSIVHDVHYVSQMHE